jgi:hypothetical protein
MTLCVLKKQRDGIFKCSRCGFTYHKQVNSECLMPHETRIEPTARREINTVNQIAPQQPMPCCGGSPINMNAQSQANKQSTKQVALWNEGMCLFVQDGAVSAHGVAAPENALVCIVCRHREAVPLGLPPDKLSRRCDSPIAESEVDNDEELREMPDIVRRLGSYGQAWLRHMANGRPESTQEQILDRFLTCVQCQQLDRSRGVCRACGCYVNTKKASDGLNKLSWADTECELGKWRRLDK